MAFLIVLTYLILIAILCLLLRVHTKGNVANLYKEPIALTLTAFILIHGLLPPIQYLYGWYRYQPGYSLYAHFRTVGLVLTFAFVMTAFYSIGHRASQNDPVPPMAMNSSGKGYLSLFIMLPSLICAGVFFYTVRSFGYESYMTNRITFNARTGGLWLLLSNWLVVSFVMHVSGYLCSAKREKLMLWASIFLGTIMIGYFGYTNNRYQICVGSLTAIGMTFVLTSYRTHLRLRNLLLSKMSLVVIGLSVLMFVIVDIRYRMVGMVSNDSPATIVLRTINGGFGNDENVLWLTDNYFHPVHGESYWAGLVSPIPRMLWPNKPVGAGPMFVNMIDPDSYVIGKEGLTSMTTGMVTESYMNGGFFGVILVAALTGLFLKWLSRRRPNCVGPWSVAIYSYTVTIFAFSMTFGEFLGVYVQCLVDLVPMVVAWFFFERATEAFGAANQQTGYDGYDTYRVVPQDADCSENARGSTSPEAVKTRQRLSSCF